MALLQDSGTELTIYNQGFALVKEVRQMTLKPGRQTVTVEDVAQQIETNSVGVKSLSDPNGFTVLEQNYQYDLISPLAILNKAVGGRVTFLRVLPNGTKESISGTLISSPTAVVGNQNGGGQLTWNGMVIRTDDQKILLNPSGEIQVDSLPDGLISKPTLLWDLVSEKGGNQKIELSYLTRGTTWNADYVLTIDGSNKGDLQGWVTLTNNSGATWKDAKLKLLAGDVQRVDRPQGRGGRPAMEMSADAMAKNFAEESLFEYHLYTLQRPTTVRNNEQKQVSLLEATGITYTKRLILDSMMDFGMYYPSEGEIGVGVIKPMVKIDFLNKTENKLGMPLPKGNVKVYQRDKSGSVQMLGEDQIEHTPRDEKLSLVVGRSFDVVGERKRLNFRRINDRTFEETFEIEVRNRKTTEETVEVWERHYGDWRILNTSQDWVKADATTQVYTVKLAANTTKKVTYTVQTRW